MDIDIHKLMTQSRQFLDMTLSNVNSGNVKDILKKLRNVIIQHNYLYYTKESPVISDFQYDQLFSFLTNIEKLYPQYITKDSPTQIVAVEIQKEFKKAEHIIPMISLDNTYNAEDLKDFDKQLSRLLPENTQREYVIELKLDGIGISLTYKNNTLIRAATRGNGLVGEDVTENAKVIESIPKEADFIKHGYTELEIRGEIVLPKKELERINEERIDEGEASFVNCRNAASGSMRQLDTRITKERNLEAYFYHVEIVKDMKKEHLKTYRDTTDLLEKLGFQTSPFSKVCKNIEEVIQICHEMEEKRYSFPFDIDGLVIKLNNLELQKEAGATEHHPRWAIAYKFPAEKAITKIQDVTFQIGRTGVITPVAELSPIKLSGATIKRATLHNFEDTERKDIRIGDMVEIERAGEVIPAVLESLPEKRTGKEKKIRPPKKCPVCESEIIHHGEEVAYRCPNLSCPAQIKGRIIHYASREGLDIEGLGESLINTLVDLGIVKSIPDIYTLKSFENIAKLEKIEGLGKKSINNLFEAIEKSKTMPLNRILNGLGIKFIGKKGAKILTQNISSLHELKKKTFEELQELPDMGPKTAASIVDFFSNEDNRRILHELEEAGVKLEVQKEKNIHPKIFEGQTIVFTGSLEYMSRQEAENIVEKLGGRTSSSVSKNTTLVVYGSSAGSKKKEAETLKIPLQTEEKFISSLPESLRPKKKTTDEDSQLSMF